MARRKTTIEAVLDVKQAEAALRSLGRTSIPLNANVGGGGGGGGGRGATSKDKGWRTGFGAQQAFQSGPFASYGVGGFITNTAMFAAAGALARVITQFPAFVASLEQINTSLRRTEVAGSKLAGSGFQFESLTDSYAVALRGYATAGEAAENVTRLLALGYADNTEEMMNFVNASRAAQLTTGRTAESIEQNLILALANADQSVGRIDQLGISMTDLNRRVKDLRDGQDDLSLGDARRIAIIEILNDRFDSLDESGELAASGLETLSTALRELKENIAEGSIGTFLSQLAVLAAAGAGTTSEGTRNRAFGEDLRSETASRRAAEQMGVLGFMNADARRKMQRDAQESAEQMAQDLNNFISVGETLGDPDIVKGAENILEILDLYSYVPVSELESMMDELESTIKRRQYQEDVRQSFESRAYIPDEDPVKEFTVNLEAATSKVWKVAESAVLGGADISSAVEYYLTATDNLTHAHENYQQAVLEGTITEEQARMEFSLMVENESNTVASALQVLSSSAMQAASILGGVESSILSGMVGSASQALSLGGDPQEVLSLLQRQEMLASDAQDQLDEMIKNGEDSVAVASFMAAQFQTSIQEDMKAYQDQLREAQKVSKGVDRTNEILSHQRNIWENFMDKFSQIEGLMSPSAVTSEQMDLASKGLYKDMPDEWLRRLKDEVFNAVDYENIDPASIFERAGLGGMDWESAYNQIEGMYESKELFAFFDPNEIFGPEAIQAIRDGLDRMERALAGEKRFQSFLASVFGDQEEIQAGLTLGIVDPTTHAWDQALQGMTKQAQESNTGPAFVNAVVAAIEDGTIRAALLNQLTVSEEELAAGIGGSVVTYDNQSAEANVTP
jgi:hypothetical protein